MVPFFMPSIFEGTLNRVCKYGKGSPYFLHKVGGCKTGLFSVLMTLFIDPLKICCFALMTDPREYFLYAEKKMSE